MRPGRPDTRHYCNRSSETGLYKQQFPQCRTATTVRGTGDLTCWSARLTDFDLDVWIDFIDGLTPKVPT